VTARSDALADAAHAAIRDAPRAEALERELVVVRVLRAEVEQLQPGLLLEQLDGWHAGAAEHYAERVREIRLTLAGAEHLLLEAERALCAALELLRRWGIASWAT
jgi:hypothetical protein